MIPDNVKEDVKKVFEQELKNEVKIVYHEDEKAQLNNETKGLLEEVASLNDKITVEITSEGDVKPSFDLFGVNKGTVRFMGIPSGHEFSTLISSIVMVSNGEHKLAEETVKFLEGLDKPLDLKVFVTPTCPYCPAAVFLAHRMAMVSDKVVGNMVEAMEFPELSQKFKVSGVPHTIINDTEGGFVGAHPEPSALEEIKKVL